MTKNEYAQDRKHPLWQKKRLEILQRDGWRCVACGDNGSQLSVHHAYYVTGRHCWEYPSFSLTSLCDDCHDDCHDRESFRICGEEPPKYDMLSEWEHELDWIFGKNVEEQGRFFTISTLIAQACDNGIDRGEIFERIESLLMPFAHPNK